MVVDVRKTKSAKAADIFLQIKPRKRLRSPLDVAGPGARTSNWMPEQVQHETGQPLAVWQDLMDRMKAAKFGVDLLRHGADDDTRQACQQRSPAGADARHEPVHAVRLQAESRTRQRHRCRQRRHLADRLSVRRESGPRLSAVQSGRVHGVRRAWPRRSRCGADRRQRSDGQLQPTGSRAPASRFPTSRWTPRKRRPRGMPTVAFTVATYGINVPGTVYRMDDVPIPLRPAFESPHPSDFDDPEGIEARVRSQGSSM